MPRCTLLPLPDHQVSFRVDGGERLCWHHGPLYPRPFFYPWPGPASGEPLTRLGHPGAPDHDHHRSIWFAHEKVSGVNFWSDRTTASIRQLQWLAYQDGDDEAVMAVRLGWFDGHDPKPLLEQDLFAALTPGPDGEMFLELQTSFRPTAEQLEFGKSNFGFLAVRMAKALSVAFGDGVLTNSDQRAGEQGIFGRPAKWMDYSGGQNGRQEGITYFDHPTNPNHPASWHVRDDGWMAASVCLTGPRVATRAKPLTLRYLLHAHRGLLDLDRAREVFQAFGRRTQFELVSRPAAHTQFGVRRASG